jgi:exosortase F-associated protein
MKYLAKILFSLFFLCLLFLIRAFETTLFYDPLIHYFKYDYLHQKIDDIDSWRLLVNLFYRYLLNSTISLGLIWILFKRKDYMKFSGVFFVLAFIILIPVFLFLLKDNFQRGYLLLFYVRRFIIQPLFLLLLVPLFFYEKLSDT